ncbi:hypothetical protein T11_6434 [Trichinella zimbabwensis]|uniref:Uncharacterized protein n=1 Tax=Trichinella zimbabwensis TaxID=268475 RepID=A0A0V1HFH7_9BILA|nr:hypothetical protein T11_6434 [Trichinella zimbabwensis]
MAVLSVIGESNFSVIGIVMILVALVTMVSWLLLCGCCGKNSGDNKQGAENVEPMSVCSPPPPYYPAEITGQQCIPLAGSACNAALQNLTPTSPPPTDCSPSTISPQTEVPPTIAEMQCPEVACLETSSICTPVGLSKVDINMESVAQGQSALDTLAEIPSITSHFELPKVDLSKIRRS